MPKFEGPTFGAPCWVDMTSGNLEGVKPFYSALFGWEYQELGEEFGNYTIISVGEDAVGGAMQYSAEFMGPEEINAWTIYFAAEDAAAKLKDATDNGGQVAAPVMQIGDQGSMAVAEDSTGGMFGIWQPGTRRGYDKWGEHGFPGWFEHHTREFDKATAFYGKVMNADVKAEDMGGGPRYATLNINGEPQAGIFDATQDMPAGVPNYWAVYFIVDDTDAAVVTAKENGGTVMVEPTDSPYGRFSMLQDPSGTIFFVISGAEL